MACRTLRRSLALLTFEDRRQPAAVQPLRVALIADTVGPVAQVQATAPRSVVTVPFDARTATFDGLVELLEGVSAAHGNVPIGHLGLVAHGRAAAVSLGAADTLDAADVATDSPTWQRLRALFAPRARLDLFACNVAAGAEGKAFVRELAARAGAAVYASDDPVGRGGDFRWEFNTAIRPRPHLLRPMLLKQIEGLSLGEDAYEENDSIAVTASRPEGAPNSPNLGPVVGNLLVQGAMEDENDFYRIVLRGTGRPGNFASIAHSATAADLVLHLYDGVGTLLQSSVFGFPTEQVSLDGLKAGSYFLRVAPYDPGQLGTLYDLQIVGPPDTGDDTYEPNDTRAQVDAAGSPANLGTVTGSVTLPGLVLDDLGNADWFRFTTAGPGRGEHLARLAHPAGDGDLDLHLYDAAGTLLESSPFGGPVEQVSLDGLKSGTYYLKVVPNYSLRPGMFTYDLQIVAPPARADDAYEPNDTRAQVDAGSPAALGTVAGSRSLIGLVMDDPLNSDWFKFSTTATGGPQDFVRLDHAAGNGDLDLHLFDAAGTLLQSSVFGGPTEQVDLGSRAAGTYYVQVRPNYALRPGMAAYDLQIKAPGTGLAVSDATVVEGTAGTANAVFTVSLSQAAAGTVTVNYATQDGTADATDYTPKAGTLTFTTGMLSQTVSVPINTDSTPEPDESFFLNLSAASGAVVNRGTGVGTIRDDDTAGTIQFSAAAYMTNENAGAATIFVTRTGGAAGGPATVAYTTSDGSATAGADYTAAADVLIFAAGETVKSFTVPVLRDAVDPEGTETVILTLSGPSGGAILGTPATATLFIENRPAPSAAPMSLVVGADAGTQPRVRVFQGETLVNDFLAYPSAFRGGVRVATGDVNGDGTADIVTAPGAGLSPEVKVFDGKTGLQLGGEVGSMLAYPSSFLGGVYVAVGDVNKDGFADIITGPHSKLGPTVNVFSGATGQLMGTIPAAFAPSFKGGVRVAAGDVNGDGYADVVATTGAGTAIRARVFDGKELAVNQKVMGLPGNLGNGKLAPVVGTGGAFVAVADVNGDTKADLIVGTGKGTPSVTVISGADGSVLRSFTALDAAQTGGVRVAVGDVNGDGKADILMAPGPLTGGTGAVRAYNGLTFAEIDLTVGVSPLWPFGELFDKGLFLAGQGI